LNPEIPQPGGFPSEISGVLPLGVRSDSLAILCHLRREEEEGGGRGRRREEELVMHHHKDDDRCGDGDGSSSKMMRYSHYEGKGCSKGSVVVVVW